MAVRSDRLLQNLAVKCAKDAGIYDYSTSAYQGTQQVGSAFSGSLAGNDLVPISTIADTPARIDERTKKVPDGAGGLVDQATKFPVWFDPVANGGTPMCQVMKRANAIVAGWLAEHPNCFPPVVLHLTDGESTDGDPREDMRAITSQLSSDGNALLFNVHISSNPNAKPTTFPDTPTGLPDQYAQLLFETASPLTSSMRTAAVGMGHPATDGSKAFILNADMVLVIQALDIGTRASNLR